MTRLLSRLRALLCPECPPCPDESWAALSARIDDLEKRLWPQERYGLHADGHYVRLEGR